MKFKLSTIRFRLGILRRYLRFYLRAQTRYDIHSPFVADFVQHIFEDGRYFYPFTEIEALRRELLRSKESIEIRDYGAGSKAQGKHVRSIAGLARHGAVDRKTGRQLFKVAQHYKPSSMLEMGTCMGISTLYLAKASPSTQLVSIEACPNTAARARQHFNSRNANNINLLNGTFKELLPGVLEKFETLDLLFLDGDHRKEPTIEYVKACLPKAGKDSIFIVADIHWSAGMEKAWNHLKALPEVKVSIDLFHIGLLFFDPAILQKADYALLRSRLKPWRLGFGW